jgi:hypothetical protein
MGKSAYLGTQITTFFFEEFFNKRLFSDPKSNTANTANEVAVVEFVPEVRTWQPTGRKLLQAPFSECPLLNDTIAAFKHAVGFMVQVYDENGPFAYTLCRSEKFTDSTKICEKNLAPESESTGTPPPACVGMCQLKPHGGDAGQYLMLNGKKCIGLLESIWRPLPPRGDTYFRSIVGGTVCRTVPSPPPSPLPSPPPTPPTPLTPPSPPPPSQPSPPPIELCTACFVNEAGNGTNMAIFPDGIDRICQESKSDFPNTCGYGMLTGELDSIIGW